MIKNIELSDITVNKKILNLFRVYALIILPFEISVKALVIPHIKHSSPLRLLLKHTGEISCNVPGEKKVITITIKTSAE